MKVLLVGGHGGLRARYEALGREHRHELEFVERGPLDARSAGRSQPGAVLVAMSMCAHPLREAAQELARVVGARYIAMRGHSVSAVRQALVALGGG